MEIIIPALSAVIALSALIYSSMIGIRANRIQQNIAYISSEQEKIRLALKYDGLLKLRAIYQSIDDFGVYLMMVLNEKHPIDRKFVQEFFERRANDLTEVRSHPNHLLLVKAFHEFKPNYVLTSEDTIEVLALIGEGSKERLTIDLLQKDSLSTVLSALEFNAWCTILHTAQKLEHLEDVDKLDGPSLKHPIDAKLLPTQKDIMPIMKITLFPLQRVKLFLVLLERYEEELVKYLDTRYTHNI